MAEAPRAHPPRNPDALVLGAFALAVLVLGMNFVAVRFSNRELAPFWGAGSRFLVAGVIFTALVAARGAPVPRGRALAGAALYGAFNFGAVYALMYWGMLEVGAGMASVAMATAPLVTFGLALAVGLEQYRWRGLAGALLAVAGAGVAFSDQLVANVPSASLAAVFGGPVFASLAVVTAKRMPRVHPLSMNAVGMLVGAVMLLAASALAREPWVLPVAPTTVAAVAWLVTSSIVGFALVLFVLARWTASATSYVTVLLPLVAVASGAVLAGETVTPAFLAGAVLVFVGVVTAIVQREPAPAPAPASVRG